MCARIIAGIIAKVQKRPLIFFAVLHAILFLAVSANLDKIVGNCVVQRHLAASIIEGNLPYSDVSSEYPPVAVLSFLLPGLISTVEPYYSLLFALEMLLLDLAVLFLLAKFAYRLNMNIWKVFGVYTLCLVVIGPLVTGRYDLLPATLVLVALYAFIRGRNKTAWLVLALGAMAKIYPVTIAPLFALYLLRYRQYKKLAQGAAIFLVVVLVISLPWLIIDAGGYWQYISYHMERGLHIESSYGSVLLVGQILGLTHTTGELSYGSWNLVSTTADSLAQVAIYVTFGLLALAYAMYARRLWQKPGDEFTGMPGSEVQFLLRYATLAVVIMLLGSKLFSPQFLIWLCPLLPLVEVRWRYALPVLILLIGSITQYIYPFNYIELEMVTPHVVILLFMRNPLLVAMAVILLLPLNKSASRENGEPAGLTPT